MEINALADDLLNLSTQYTDRYGIERSTQWCLLKLTEELGELTQAYLKASGQSRKACETGLEVEDELADVLGMVLILGKELGVDFHRGLERKWFRHRESNNAALASMRRPL